MAKRETAKVSKAGKSRPRSWKEYFAKRAALAL